MQYIVCLLWMCSMNSMNPNKIQWKHIISDPPWAARSLLLLIGKGFPGELLQRAVPGQPPRQHHAALRADLELGPLRAVPAHDVALGTLQDLGTEVVSIRPLEEELYDL